MLPEQLLANSDALRYFDSVHFLCLTCPPDVLHARISRRDGADVARSRVELWLDFDSKLRRGGREIPTATVVDAGRGLDEVEHDVRHWINTHL